MGREQTGARKQVYVHFAILIVFIMSGCSFWPTKDDKKEMAVRQDNAANHILLGRKLFGEADFAGALREYDRAASLSTDSTVIHESLLYAGLIYADPANPKRDYGKSIAHLKRLTESHSKSPYAEHARIMLTIMRENDESNRTIERLKALIEASKKVDIGIEDKKREKTR